MFLQPFSTFRPRLKKQDRTDFNFRLVYHAGPDADFAPSAPSSMTATLSVDAVASTADRICRTSSSPEASTAAILSTRRSRGMPTIRSGFCGGGYSFQFGSGLFRFSCGIEAWSFERKRTSKQKGIRTTASRKAVGYAREHSLQEGLSVTIWRIRLARAGA